MNISMKLVYQYMALFHTHQIIFIHYKSRIAAAIRGLQWMKMTMVNSGLKGLKEKPFHCKDFYTRHYDVK